MENVEWWLTSASAEDSKIAAAAAFGVVVGKSRAETHDDDDCTRDHRTMNETRSL